MRSEEFLFAEQLLMEYDSAHQEIDKISIDRGTAGDNIQDICKAVDPLTNGHIVPGEILVTWVGHDQSIMA